MPKLTDPEIAERLKAVPHWTREGDAIRRQFTCPSFADAVAFIVRVGFDAEAADHHPDIAFGWGYAEILTTTHDRGGVTDVDIALASKIDAL